MSHLIIPVDRKKACEGGPAPYRDVTSSVSGQTGHVIPPCWSVFLQSHEPGKPLKGSIQTRSEQRRQPPLKAPHRQTGLGPILSSGPSGSGTGIKQLKTSSFTSKWNMHRDVLLSPQHKIITTWCQRKHRAYPLFQTSKTKAGFAPPVEF